MISPLIKKVKKKKEQCSKIESSYSSPQEGKTEKLISSLLKLP